MLLNGDGNAVIKYVPEYGTINQKYTIDKRIVTLNIDMHKGGNWDNWYDGTELMQYDVILTNEAVICGLTPEKVCNIKEFAA